MFLIPNCYPAEIFTTPLSFQIDPATLGSEVGTLEKSNCDASILEIRGFQSLSLNISNFSDTVL